MPKWSAALIKGAAVGKAYTSAEVPLLLGPSSSEAESSKRQSALLWLPNKAHNLLPVGPSLLPICRWSAASPWPPCKTRCIWPNTGASAKTATKISAHASSSHPPTPADPRAGSGGRGWCLAKKGCQKSKIGSLSVFLFRQMVAQKAQKAQGAFAGHCAKRPTQR